MLLNCGKMKLSTLDFVDLSGKSSLVRWLPLEDLYNFRWWQQFSHFPARHSIEGGCTKLDDSL